MSNIQGLPGQNQQTGQRAVVGTATVRYGVYNQPGPYVGRTIGQIRAELGPMWNIPADAQAYKGKELLDASYEIQPNDNIEFHRKMGEKG